MNRRYFLAGSAAAVGGAVSSSALASPNDTIRMAHVGIRGQGNSHIRQVLGQKGVEIAALCDIDESVLNKRVDEVEKAQKKRPAAFTDFR